MGTRPAEECKDGAMIVWKWKEGFDCLCCPDKEPSKFIPVEVKAPQIDAMLLAAGMVESMAAAQRMVKGGGVSYRVDGCFPWVRAKDPREKVSEGQPILIRVGNGNWRLTPRVESQGFVQWPGIVMMMVPAIVEGTDENDEPYQQMQTIEVWNDICK
jgi:hypothetical protein